MSQCLLTRGKKKKERKNKAPHVQDLDCIKQELKVTSDQWPGIVVLVRRRLADVYCMLFVLLAV